jgi:hypothetical protein
MIIPNPRTFQLALSIPCQDPLAQCRGRSSAPNGAAECSHGWSGARRQAGRAEPVDEVWNREAAPRGAEEWRTRRRYSSPPAGAGTKESDFCSTGSAAGGCADRCSTGGYIPTPPLGAENFVTCLVSAAKVQLFM